jgi:hypothetical protein
MRTPGPFLLLSLLLPLAPLAVAAPSTVAIDGAWVRAAPPGASAMAAYATLRNSGDGAVEVRPCPSEGFASVELHETVHDGGMARMRPLPSLTVPAGGSAALAPGGAHLMLMAPAAQPGPGDRVTLCLSVDGVEVRHDFEVRRTAPDASHHHHGH